MFQNAADQPGVTVGKPCKAEVEEVKRARLLLMSVENHRAQRRRPGQRDHPGDHHRDRHGDRELPIKLASDAAEKGHRDEGRGKHEDARHDDARDLPHGLEGGLPGRQSSSATSVARRSR